MDDTILNTGEYASINAVLDAIRAARLDWAKCDAVFSQLGVALRATERALDKAGVAKRKEITDRVRAK